MAISADLQAYHTALRSAAHTLHANVERAQVQQKMDAALVAYKHHANSDWLNMFNRRRKIEHFKERREEEQNAASKARAEMAEL